MTEQEKKFLQAKHRMEEAEARNRKKERSIRTRRLIQEGAILESVFPQAQHMELEALKAILEQRLSTKGRTYTQTFPFFNNFYTHFTHL